MRHCRRVLQLSSLAVLLSSHALLAGGWPQEIGESFFQITYGTSSSNEVYRFDGNTKFPTDNGGATVRDYPLADRGLYLYIEHGVTSKLTLIGNLALKRSMITSPLERRTTEGFGDIGVAGRYLLFKSDPHVLSGRLGVIIPTGYSRDLTPPIGNGNLNVELGAEYGISFYPTPAYATASASYRLRPSIYAFSTRDDETTEFEPDYADAITADIEGGYTIADRVLVKGMARFLKTIRTDDNDFDVVHPPTTEEYLKVGGGIAADVKHGFSVSADVLTTVRGLKTAKSVDLFFGIAWKGNLLGSDE